MERDEMIHNGMERNLWNEMGWDIVGLDRHTRIIKRDGTEQNRRGSWPALSYKNEINYRSNHRNPLH